MWGLSPKELNSNQERNKGFDIPSTIPANITPILCGWFRECLVQLHHLYYDELEQSEVNDPVNVKTKSEFNLLEIELTNHKLKTLDVINVKIGEGNYKKYLVSVAGRKVYIDY